MSGLAGSFGNGALLAGSGSLCLTVASSAVLEDVWSTNEREVLPLPLQSEAMTP